LLFAISKFSENYLRYTSHLNKFLSFFRRYNGVSIRFERRNEDIVDRRVNERRADEINQNKSFINHARPRQPKAAVPIW